jgi:hypothetical protein
MKYLFDGNGVLCGWQQIADYLHCSVSTTKRWEKKAGLPILFRASGRPMALKYELDLYHLKINQTISKIKHDKELETT